MRAGEEVTNQEIKDNAPDETASHYYDGVLGEIYYYKIINSVVYFWCVNEWAISEVFDIDYIYLLKPL